MTPTVRPNIDLDQAGRLMRLVEVHHDATGWHRHADMHVYVVYDRRDVVTADLITQVMQGMGPAIRNSRYAAQTMLPVRVFHRAYEKTGQSHAESLDIFAHNTAFADPAALETKNLTDGMEAFRQLLQIPGIHGFLACAEANGIRGSGAGNAVRRAVGGDEYIADMDGAEELRNVIMVDASGRVHKATRWRGEPVQLDMDIDFIGSVTNSLRILMDTANNQLPTTQEEHDQQYASLEDYMRKAGHL